MSCKNNNIQKNDDIKNNKIRNNKSLIIIREKILM